MAWTTPSTRSYGNRITHTIWNTDLVDNLIYLKNYQDTYAPLPSKGSEVSLTDTNETTLYSETLSGGILLTDTIFSFRIWIRHNNGSGAARNFTLRFKYGATTLFATSRAVTNGGDFYSIIDITFKGDGATNAQEAMGMCLGTFSGTYQGTSAIDSTTDQTVAITAQLDNAGSVTFNVKSVTVQGPFYS